MLFYISTIALLYGLYCMILYWYIYFYIIYGLNSSQALDIRRWFGFIVMVETLASLYFFFYTFGPIEPPRDYNSP